MGSTVGILRMEIISNGEKSTRMSAVTMVLGGFIADAATMPLHWIYNQEEVTDTLDGLPPAFFPTPSCPFYSYPLGSLSPYGHEVIPFLRSISSQGSLVTAHAAETSYHFFKSYKGRLNHVCSQFVASRDEGKAWADCACTDHQAQGLVKVPLIVARYAGSPELLDRIEDSVKVIQKSEISVSSCKLLARVLERVLVGRVTPANALSWISQPEQLTTLSAEAQDFILFVTNDNLLQAWSLFASRLRLTQVSLDEPYVVMRLLAKVLLVLLKERDLKASLQAAGHSSI